MTKALSLLMRVLLLLIRAHLSFVIVVLRITTVQPGFSIALFQIITAEF